MQSGKLISANECCVHYNIEFSFISTLQEYGLIEITTIEETQFIYTNQLQKLEKFIRLYYELDINIEGIEAIINLLNRVEHMQEEITYLKNKLSFLSRGDVFPSSASL